MVPPDVGKELVVGKMLRIVGALYAKASPNLVLEEVKPDTVTLTATVPPPEGLLTMICESVQEEIVAVKIPKLTDPCDCTVPNPYPVMVTAVLPQIDPDVG